MARSYDQLCPIARTLDIIGDRWTLLILRDMFFGRTKFHELRDHSPGIPSKILSDRLKLLEAHGMIERRIYNMHPLRAEYHLTDLGVSLSPVVEAIASWGMEHTVTARERRPLLNAIQRGITAAANSPMSLWALNWTRQPASKAKRKTGS